MSVRVVHVFTVPESLGFMRGQPAFMRERGFDLTVVTSPGPGLEAFGTREAVPFYGIPMARRIAPAADAQSLARLVGLLQRLRPSIVHAHTPKGGLIGMTAAFLARVPARLYHMRGLPLVTARGTQRALLAAAERTSCALAHRVLAVSDSLRETALAERLTSPAKIQVLGGGSGNGVDSERFDPVRPGADRGTRRALRERLGIADDAKVVGFVGRLVGDKGVNELVTAFRALQERDARGDLHLVVGGVFEERDAVPPETRRALEEDPRVHLLGFVEDTPALFAAIDVLALPTYREGFPNVPLEAAAMEVPVVATRIPGCVDAVVDGETGLLVPVRDADALADALARYLDDPALRETHGRAGRARVLASYRRTRIWEGIASVYDELLASRA